MVCADVVREVGPEAWLLPGCKETCGHRVETVGEIGTVAPRLHLHHGPIDLIIDAVGSRDEVEKSYHQAGRAFASVLDVLCVQLAQLRTLLYLDTLDSSFSGDVARRMVSAARPFQDRAVTPMIAVAGAVADHILASMLERRRLDRVQVNNGGDIALYLSSGSRCRIGICTSTGSAAHPDIILLDAESGVGGVATSGWQGRSHSLGIADAVTVLSHNAASADAAATLIANAIDLPASAKVERVPACTLAPDSDLGVRPVTVLVGSLSEDEKTTALQAGCDFAGHLLAQGLIAGAFLHLQGQSRVVGTRFDDIRLKTASTGT